MQCTRLTPITVLVLAIAVLIIVISLPTLAAESTKSVSLWTQTSIWLMEQQRDYHRELTTALKSLSQEENWETITALILGSFLYGIFHAAGPGHGKAVLTSYLLSHGENLGRTLSLATLAAFCQGVVAILIVYGLIYLAGWLPRETSSAVQWSERLSFFLVAVLGAWLAFRALKAIYRFWRARQDFVGLTHDHGAPHSHGTDAACGHDHLPSPKQMDAARDWRGMIGVALSIGMRPCSGAILVLVFAKAFGIAWSGIWAVFAMSAGTAITVASLALLAIKARGIASSLIKSDTGNWAMVSTGIALLGGMFILAIGIGLLSLSFSAAHPLRL
jgi:nickel/cobalt transporter (NicO) family protein